MLIGTIDFYHLYLFTDLDLGERSQGKQKAKPLGFIFSRTFQLIRMKFDVVLKDFFVVVVQNEIIETREISFLRTASKNFNISMHTDIHQGLTFIWTVIGQMSWTTQIQ